MAKLSEIVGATEPDAAPKRLRLSDVAPPVTATGTISAYEPTLFDELKGAAEPEGRTAGEWLNDTALMLRRGARNVTSGLLGAPVDLINLAIDPLPARLIRGGGNALGVDIKMPAEHLGLPVAIEQPELVKGLRESIRRETLADTAATGSTTLAREQQ